MNEFETTVFNLHYTSYFFYNCRIISSCQCFFPLVSKSTNILIYNSWYLRIVVILFFIDSITISIIFSHKRPFRCFLSHKLYSKQQNISYPINLVYIKIVCNSRAFLIDFLDLLENGYFILFSN